MSVEPVLYTGTTAAWCKGGCGKFRYPYCYLCDRPICATCAIALQLNPVKSTIHFSSLPQTRKKQETNWKTLGVAERAGNFSARNSQPRFTRFLRISLPYYQLHTLALSHQLLILNKLWLKTIFTFWTTKKAKISQKEKASFRGNYSSEKCFRFADGTNRFLRSLLSDPHTSKQLMKELNLSAYSFLKISKSLLESGLVIAKKERSSRGIYWYALPDQKSRLDTSVGISLESLVLEQLAIAPMTAQELSNKIPYYELNWISNLLGQLVARGELIGKGANRRRMYALPKAQLSVDWAEFDPINTAILGLLKYRPYLWVREIARRLDKAPKTVSNRLTQLEKLKLVSVKVQGKQKLYVVRE